MHKKVDFSEHELEELVRLHPGLIEEGLSYVTHQSQTRTGRLDVLLVDSGKSLVIAELKVVEDDAMLTQCIDYFDHVSGGVETYSRIQGTVTCGSQSLDRHQRNPVCGSTQPADGLLEHALKC